FIFSGRRRHTRFSRAWSSDVCSSDLLDVVRDEVDLAIRYGNLVDSRLVARCLVNTAPVVVAAPSYLARHPAPRTPMELTRHNCQIGRASCRAIVNSKEKTPT